MDKDGKEKKNITIVHLPRVDTLDSFISQNAGHRMQASLVLASLRSLTTELHPVLHQIQRLYEDRRPHPVRS